MIALNASYVMLITMVTPLRGIAQNSIIIIGLPKTTKAWKLPSIVGSNAQIERSPAVQSADMEHVLAYLATLLGKVTTDG